jgi:hypothetical protein
MPRIGAVIPTPSKKDELADQEALRSPVNCLQASLATYASMPIRPTSPIAAWPPLDQPAELAAHRVPESPS